VNPTKEQLHNTPQGHENGHQDGGRPKAEDHLHKLVHFVLDLRHSLRVTVCRGKLYALRVNVSLPASSTRPFNSHWQ
jgi:hypothetical protein